MGLKNVTFFQVNNENVMQSKYLDAIRNARSFFQYPAQCALEQNPGNMYLAYVLPKKYM